MDCSISTTSAGLGGKIRSESMRPYLILGQQVYFTVSVIAVTFSSALKITSREPTVQRAPL